MTLNHLELINRIFVVAFVVIFTIKMGHSQTSERDLEVYPYWRYYGDVSNTLYEILAERAFEQLDERKRVIQSLETKEDWKDRQQYVKSTLAEIVGPFPERNPLDPVVTDTIIRDGMVIEKLYFESRPDYYVTAIFCYPEGASEPLPAILFCSGHAAEGFRSTTYQHMIFNYVKKGFAVLAFDPIGQGERKRYLDEDGKPRMGPTKEHSYPGSQTFLAGISPANFFIWDGIRSVDYLMTREIVDPDRIGITGRSGGGTQTAYIAAMDERIYAAAPECYITTFDKLLKSKGPQDAEQNLMNGIAKGIDIADYIEVRAPKPTLIVSTTRDIFSIQGVRDVYQEAQKVYQILGEPSHLQKVEDNAPHASTVKNREATYAFFRNHLQKPGPVRDEEVVIFEPEELWVLPTGNVYRDLGGEDIYSLTLNYLKDQEVSFPESHDALRKTMIELSGYHPMSVATENIFSGRMVYEDCIVEKYLIRGMSDYYLPVVWIKPIQETDKTVLWIDEAGKGEAGAKDGPVDRWLETGYSVVIPDLSGLGELGDGYKGGDARIQNVPLNIWYAGILTSKSVSAIHGEEMAIVRNFIQGKIGSTEDLILMGRGTLGSELVQTAFMEDWKERIVVVESLAGYRSIFEDREYDARFLMSSIPGSLLHFDLPLLFDALGADQILEVDPVDGDNASIPRQDIVNIITTSDQEDRFGQIIDWLE